MTTKKSSLMTPDPYHIPGYIGYCPQFKYQIGETFGRTTSQLLTDTRIASSGRPVLCEINPDLPPVKDQRKYLISRRAYNLGDQKLFEKMVPGYTGFIPKGEHHFGKRYAETCLSAVADFERDQDSCKQRLQDLQTVRAVQSGLPVPLDRLNANTVKLGNYQTPLKQGHAHPAVYYSKNAPQHSLSPLTMGNENTKKFFMSGYTGFVPRARGYIGIGYPKVTNKGLCNFTDECDRLKDLKGQPVQVYRQISKKHESKPLYKKDVGMVPHYTGHVPDDITMWLEQKIDPQDAFEWMTDLTVLRGEKFRYGRTFGHSTKNAQPIQIF